MTTLPKLEELTGKADTPVYYVSDGEQHGHMTLRQLILNFVETETEFSGRTGERHRNSVLQDLVYDVLSRGWYENDHQCGRFLVLNTEIIPVEGRV